MAVVDEHDTPTIDDEDADEIPEGKTATGRPLISQSRSNYSANFVTIFVLIRSCLFTIRSNGDLLAIPVLAADKGRYIPPPPTMSIGHYNIDRRMFPSKR